MRLVALGFFVFSAAAAARLAFAAYLYRQDSAGAVARAAHAVECAEYARRLAELDPEHARQSLQQAILWNPRSSAAHIALGLDRELSGDFERAELALLAAAAFDRQYVPAWSLANFYFRRGNADAFWPWAARAAQLDSGDLGPLLVLCDRIAPGSATDRLPDSPRIDREYLDLLITRSRWQEARTVARKISARAEPDDISRLKGFTTRLIDAGQFPMAIELWREISPAPRFPVNGDLHSAPSGEGFDWREPRTDGVAGEWTNGMISFQLSGRQPESCPLLEQPIALDRGEYRLGFEYSIAGVDSGATGVRWMIDEAATGELESRPQRMRDTRTFEISRAGVKWLRLVYRRDAGTPRARESIEIRDIRLDRMEAQ